MYMYIYVYIYIYIYIYIYTGMLHELATGDAFKMPDADDDIHGRSFWSGLSHRDTSEKIEEIAEEESQSDR